MGRVDPGTARVTAVTPLEELDTAVTTLAVGAGGVWVGGALHLSPVPRVKVLAGPPFERRTAATPVTMLLLVLRAGGRRSAAAVPSRIPSGSAGVTPNTFDV
jgi:hypothetical protein